MKIIISIVILGLAVLGCMAVKRNADSPEPEVKARNKKEVVLTLPDKNGDFTVLLGEKLRYSASVYASVGNSYRVEYDKEAFRMKSHTEYDDPESVAMGMCGGDSAVETCVFTPLKRGRFTIKVIHEFRGDVERIVTFNIKVR